MPPPKNCADARAVDSRIIRTHNDILQAALEVLIDQGQQAVTHSHLAQVAGYSRATVYKHWPTRADLLRAAFSRLAEMPHHTPTGDLRTDLIEELMSFRLGIAVHRLDRALTVLVDLSTTVPELVGVRQRLVTDGEHVVRELLQPVLAGSRLEAAILMLCGAILQAALMHGQPPPYETIAASVDLTLAGLDVGEVNRLA